MVDCSVKKSGFCIAIHFVFTAACGQHASFHEISDALNFFSCRTGINFLRACHG